MRFDIDNCGFTFDKTIQVSKGEKTFPFVTLMKVDDVCFIVNHAKQKLPFKKELLSDSGYNSERGYSWQYTPSGDYSIISEGITSLQCNPCSGIITFSYLLGYCEAMGVDLTDYLD